MRRGFVVAAALAFGLLAAAAGAAIAPATDSTPELRFAEDDVVFDDGEEVRTLELERSTGFETLEVSAGSTGEIDVRVVESRDIEDDFSFEGFQSNRSDDGFDEEDLEFEAEYRFEIESGEEEVEGTDDVGGGDVVRVYREPVDVKVEVVDSEDVQEIEVTESGEPEEGQEVAFEVDVAEEHQIEHDESVEDSADGGGDGDDR